MREENIKKVKHIFLAGIHQTMVGTKSEIYIFISDENQKSKQEQRRIEIEQQRERRERLKEYLRQETEAMRRMAKVS